MSKLLSKLNAPCLALLLFTIHCSLFTASAQTSTATLSGTVQDQQGAMVPGAAVTVVNGSTGARRNAVTNNDGAFTVTFLSPGTYTVTITRDGFASVQVSDLVLNVADNKALAVELKVGNPNAVVDVTKEASLIDQGGAVATVIDRQFVSNLPLNARSFQSLILLTPGVVVTPALSGSVGQFSVNGQRSNANYFTVDGVSANSGITYSAGAGTAETVSQQLAGALPSQTALGTTHGLLSVDALEEFKIQTSSYSAEFGRQPGGQIQLTSRAGTNEFHGSAFDYIRNEAFDANDWFVNSRPLTAQQIAEGLTKQPRARLRQNQFGGTFSGPLMLPRFGENGEWYWSGRNRTFFFFSYEGLRALQPDTRRRFVPSQRLRDNAAPAMRPILNALPISTEPETIVNGQFSGFSPYTAIASSPKRIDSTSIRIDHTISSDVTVFGRYSDTPSQSLTRFLSLLRGEKDSARLLTIGSTQLFGSRISNEIRFNYTKSQGRSTLGMDNLDGAVPIELSALVTGYQGSGVVNGSLNLPSPASYAVELGNVADMRQEQVNLTDSVSWTIRNHRVKFGVDYRRLAPFYGPTEYGQSISFFNVQNVFDGVASRVGIFARKSAKPRFNNYSLYVDDTWSAAKRLTVNLGLRWEINPPPNDATGLKPTLVCGVENLATATLCPVETPLRKTSYTAFAPRFGAAYMLNSKSGRETVLRGGVGIYYDLGNTADLVGFSRYPFLTSSPTLANVSLPLTAEQAQLPVFSPVTLPLFQDVTAVNPDLKLPFTLQWNVGLEQSLGPNEVVSISYVAAAGRRLLSTTSINNPPLNSTRPNPNFWSIAYTANGPTSDYHSMQVRYQRRLSRGLQALANYTWSHAIDEVSSEFDQTLERGNADFDVRHNVTAALTYDFPTINAGPILTAIARDWSFDSTIYIQSGSPLNVVNDNFLLTRQDGTQVSVRPDVVSGQPFWIDDLGAPGGRKLNFNAFAVPPTTTTCPPFQCLTALRQGTLGRNVVREPARYQVNVALRRQFSITERLNLQLKAEAFNVLNHPHFARFENRLSVGSSSFGKAGRTLDRALGGLASLYQLGGPRSLQFSARLSF